MTISEIQKITAEFVGAYNLNIPVSMRLLDLQSELGEVAKEVLKSTQYGKEPFTPTEEWESELGDVLFALLCIANSTGVDLEQALNKVMEKYEKRLAAKGEPGSGR